LGPLSVPVPRCTEPPFRIVLSYPRESKEYAKRIVEQLMRLGVHALVFNIGSTRVGEVTILGKGHKAVVVLGESRFGRVACKIRRTDAVRDTLAHEAELLRRANAVGVGPRLYAASEDVLIMAYVEGEPLVKWLQSAEATQIRRVLATLLHQCYRLDQIGIDHGELSDPKEHVIVTGDGRPVIIDFESASVQRRPRNLTAITQFLILRPGAVSQHVRRVLDVANVQEVLSCLRAYKNAPSEPTFKQLLLHLGLETENQELKNKV